MVQTWSSLSADRNQWQSSRFPMADQVPCDGPSAQADLVPAGIDTEVTEGNENSASLEPAIPEAIDAIELALVGHDQDSEPITPAGIDSGVVALEFEKALPAASQPDEAVTDEKGENAVPAVESHPPESESRETDTPALQNEEIPPESEPIQVVSEQEVPAGTCPVESAMDENGDLIVTAEKRSIAAESMDVDVIPDDCHPLESVMDEKSDAQIPTAEKDATPLESENTHEKNEPLIPAGSHSDESVMDEKDQPLLPAAEKAAIPSDSMNIETETEQPIPTGCHPVELVMDGNPADYDIAVPAEVNSDIREEEPTANCCEQDNDTAKIPAGMTTGDLTKGPLDQPDGNPSQIDGGDAESVEPLTTSSETPELMNDVKIHGNMNTNAAIPAGSQSSSCPSQDATDEVPLTGLITDQLKLKVENLSQQVLHCIDHEKVTATCHPPTEAHPKMSLTLNDKEKEASPDWPPPPPPPPQFHIYRRRWLMLAMFAVVSGMNGFHWIHYPIIGSIIKHFYDITDDQVNWVSLSFMLGYPILFFPGAWICQKIVRFYRIRHLVSIITKSIRFI